MKIELVKGSPISINPKKKYFILLTSTEGWTTADVDSANKEIHKTFRNVRVKADKCKNCGKKIPYKKKNPIRLFCNLRCFIEWNQGENHTQWKGDIAGYTSIHAWIKRIAGQPSLCERCGTTTAKKFEWANISGQYKRERSDWIRLCTRCHHAMDNLRAKQWATIKSRKLPHDNTTVVEPSGKLSEKPL